MKVPVSGVLEQKTCKLLSLRLFKGSPPWNQLGTISYSDRGVPSSPRRWAWTLSKTRKPLKIPPKRRGKSLQFTNQDMCLNKWDKLLTMDSRREIAQMWDFPAISPRETAITCFVNGTCSCFKSDSRPCNGVIYSHEKRAHPFSLVQGWA